MPTIQRLKLHEGQRAIINSPARFNVAVKRWQAFTGQHATHADTGQPFAEVTNGKNT